MKLYCKLMDRLWHILACFLALLMAALVVIVFWQVICQVILKDSTGWTGEASTVVFVWATYLGAALAIHQGSQISMTLLVVKLNGPVRQIVLLISALICEVFYGAFTLAGLEAMRKFARVSSPSLNLPMPIIYGAIAVSGFIMLIYGVGEIVRPIRQLLHPVEETKQDGGADVCP